VGIELTHSNHFAGARHIVVKHEVILDTAFAHVLSLKKKIPLKQGDWSWQTNLSVFLIRND